MIRTTGLFALAIAMGALLAFAACNKSADQQSAGATASSTLAAANGAGQAPAMCAEHNITEPCTQCAGEGKACGDCPAGSAACPEGKACPEGAACPAEKTTAATMLTLGSGEQVPIISVAKLDGDAKSCPALIALEGKVSSVAAERGAFVLVDCAKMAGCGDGCCPQAEVPVSLDMAKFEGSLPAPEDTVLVVAQLSHTTSGYQLAVQEVRKGEQVLLKASADSQA